MPLVDGDVEQSSAAAAAGGMLASGGPFRLGSHTGSGKGRGFIGRVGPAPIFPTTFVFGSGTALRTRRD
ncbi:hypothetical protein D3H35_19255 [Cohnella faecalis]|uniref:Uncharacterized protein n=1 Tax=Cohnella faecalis TaxID=2315694 RepID=A0A398CSK2_9BACL|nr:hypothetical protein D3H35_19255 [Cohnella faecalis]